MGDVTDYIASVSEPARTMLERLRARAVALVPDAVEGKSYGMAALRYGGRPLISVVAAKHGYSVFPFSSVLVELAVDELVGFDSTKGGIRFTDEQPIPDPVYDRLVLGRRDEIDAANTKR